MAKKESTWKRYAQEQRAVLAASKPSTKIGLTIIYDIIWYVAAVGLGLVFILFLDWVTAKTGILPLDQLAALPEAQVQQTLSTIRSFAWASAIGFLLFISAMVCTLVFLKGQIWSIIASERLNGLKFIKLLGIRAGWGLAWILMTVTLWILAKGFASEFIWILPFIVIIVWAKPTLKEALWIIPFVGLLFSINLLLPASSYELGPVIRLVLVIMHYTIPLYIQAIKKPSLSVLSRALNEGTRSLAVVLPVYIIAGVLFLAMNLVLSFLRFLPESAMAAISYVIFLCFFAWMRWYVYQAYAFASTEEMA